MEYFAQSIRYMKLTVSNIRIMSFMHECLSVASCLITSNWNAIIGRSFVITLTLHIRVFLELEISSQIAELHHHLHHTLPLFITIIICGVTITINTNPAIKNSSQFGSETIVSFWSVSYSVILSSCPLNNYVEMFISVIDSQVCLLQRSSYFQDSHGISENEKCFQKCRCCLLHARSFVQSITKREWLIWFSWNFI